MDSDSSTDQDSTSLQTPNSKVWKLTGLPTEIVRASICHIQNNGGIESNNTIANANAKALVPILEHGRLVQLCLSENFASPGSLLNRIRREQRKIRSDGVAWHKSVVLARQFMDVFGPHWEATLDLFCEETRSGYFDMTICPRCRMLVQWCSGCSFVLCSACDHFFRWDPHVTDWVQIREACRNLAEPRSISWRRRVLALAETMVRRSIESHRERLLARKRPVLRCEDNHDGDNYEREYEYDCDYEYDYEYEYEYDYEDPETIDEGTCLSSPHSPPGFGDGFGLRQADADEESGDATAAAAAAATAADTGCGSVVGALECHDTRNEEERSTISCSGIETTDSSLSVASITGTAAFDSGSERWEPPGDRASDAGDDEETSFSFSFSAPSADGATAAANTADGNGTSGSWSVLSGCETVHSMEREGDRPLSYCTAAKLGMSRARKQARRRHHQATGATPVSPSEPQPFVPVVPDPGQPPIGSPVPETHGTARPESKDDDDNDDDDDDDNDNDDCESDPALDVLSIYEGAKSGHGGRSALRFKGNSRTPMPACVYWGNQRRPNWSRKRRKQYKITRANYYC